MRIDLEEWKKGIENGKRLPDFGLGPGLCFELNTLVDEDADQTQATTETTSTNMKSITSRGEVLNARREIRC